jgi:hypothetical protein
MRQNANGKKQTAKRKNEFGRLLVFCFLQLAVCFLLS